MPLLGPPAPTTPSYGAPQAQMPGSSPLAQAMMGGGGTPMLGNATSGGIGGIPLSTIMQLYQQKNNPQQQGGSLGGGGAGMGSWIRSLFGNGMNSPSPNAAAYGNLDTSP